MASIHPDEAGHWSSDSWYSIMAGMGIFPANDKLRAPNGHDRYSMDEIDNLLSRSTANFRAQKELLADIPMKVHEKSLQIYFW